MTRHEIAEIACRILALWMFAQAAVTGLAWTGVMILMLIISAADGGRDALESMPLGIAALAPLVVGAFLWLTAATIARLVTREDSSPVTRPDLTRHCVLAVALVAVAAFVLFDATRGIANQLVRVLLDEYSFSEWWASAGWQATVWSHVIALALGIGMILGAQRIAKRVLGPRAAADAAPIGNTTTG